MNKEGKVIRINKRVLNKLDKIKKVLSFYSSISYSRTIEFLVDKYNWEMGNEV